MNEIDDVQTLAERIKLVKKQKRKNLSDMKRLKRRYVKAKLEKKRINREVKLLQAEWKKQVELDPEAAKSKFAKDVKSISIEEIFPPDLEKEFDNIELRHMRGKARTLDVEDLRKDKGLDVIPKDVAKEIERELAEELKGEDVVETNPNDANDPIEAHMQAEMENVNTVGLSDHDIIIGEDGEENEEADDEEK
jgi:hypothetical protein